MAMESQNNIPALNFPELSSELYEFIRNKHQQRSALFWVIMQKVVVFSYRRFGTAYRSNLPGYRSRNVGKKLPLLAA